MFEKKGECVTKIVILGAGLTGLSVAYHLEQSGYTDFKVFEKNSRPGGLLRSHTVDGFTFDYTGHLLHINDETFRTFLSTIGDFSDLLSIQRKSAIYSHNALTEYPFQMNLYGLPELVIYECINGFINRKTSMKKPANFYEWVLKHYGAGFGKHFFFPYQKKILAYDLKKLLPSWTGRFVPKTSLKEILSGALNDQSHAQVGYNHSFYYPKTGGIEHLIKQLVKHIKAPIQNHHHAVEIDIKNRVVHFQNGHFEQYDRLISTIPLPQLLHGARETSRTTFNHAEKKLQCASVINFNLGFNRDNISSKQWIYFPESDYPFYRLGFWNNINPLSVPPGCSALYGESSFLHGTKSERQIIHLQNAAINQALKYLRLDHSSIITQKILKLRYAYVIYDTWREKNLTKLLQELEKNFIHSVGRFGAWKYSSMQEAVLDGKMIAEKLLQEMHFKIHNDFIPALRFNERKIPSSVQNMTEEKL